MFRLLFSKIAFSGLLATLLLIASAAHSEELHDGSVALLQELSAPVPSNLEELVLKNTASESVEGVATYYARKFVGRKTSSGHRYNPEKLTAAHQSLPLGTVVTVTNPVTRQEVQVTINDRCAPKLFHFIDLSRAAAKKIGLWGKGRIKVVITPLLKDSLKKPA